MEIFWNNRITKNLQASQTTLKKAQMKLMGTISVALALGCLLQPISASRLRGEQPQQHRMLPGHCIQDCLNNCDNCGCSICAGNPTCARLLAAARDLTLTCCNSDANGNLFASAPYATFGECMPAECIIQEKSINPENGPVGDLVPCPQTPNRGILPGDDNEPGPGVSKNIDKPGRGNGGFP